MKRLLLIALMAVPAAAQETRIASDFEIAQMKQQIERSRDFVSQLSGHLNLGDLYATRNERATAVARYSRALEIAIAERHDARRDSDMTRYSTATSYAALAYAKLGRRSEAFTLLEEAIRFSSDSAKSWNLYASAMSLLGKTPKAESAARNAVTIAARDVDKSPTVENRLDLALYQYSLASAVPDADAERLLRRVTESLRSAAFDPLRREIARTESFEIYSSARGDAAAYLSLLNRAQLRLAALLEQRGETESAKDQYQRVLETRTDDATALSALARLSRTAEERERYFAAAFEANPFSLSLIREYRRHLDLKIDVAGTTTGGRMRAALHQMARGESRAARATLDDLIQRHPDNETVMQLRQEAESCLDCTGLRQTIALLRSDRLTPEQRAALDRDTFVSTATFDSATLNSGQTVFESGVIDGVPFRFPEPTAFTGSFAAGSPLRLTYRILGATELRGADALLLEPLKLEVRR